MPSPVQTELLKKKGQTHQGRLPVYDVFKPTMKMEFPSVPTLFDISLRNCCRILHPPLKQELREHDYLLKLLRTGAFSVVSEMILEHFVKFYSRSLSDGCLQVVCPPHLRDLSLKGCFNLSWAGVEQALRSLHCLRSLDLSGCYQLISDCCLWCDIDTSNPELTSDLTLATTLTTLKLDECEYLRDPVVQNFLRGLRSLQHLSVSDCYKLTDRVFLLDEELQLSRLTQTGKMQQGYGCHLISVDLSGCHGISSTAVRHLVTLTGPTLKSINLNRCTQVDCLALLYLSGFGLSSSVPIITLAQIELLRQRFSRSLGLAGYLSADVCEVKFVDENSGTIDSEVSTTDLANSMCSRSEIHQKQENTDDNDAYVDQCYLPEEVENEIKTGIPHKEMYSSDLTSLKIEDMDLSYPNSSLVKICLETFFKHNKKLVKLEISLRSLTNEMMSFITTQAGHLEEVSLIKCEQASEATVTNRGIKNLGEHCKKISTLKVKGTCWGKCLITYPGIMPCLTNSSLRHLHLVNCEMADFTLQKVAESLSDTLQSLHVVCCEGITESGMAAMLSRTFFCLKDLFLCQSPFSNQLLTLLSDRCPVLTSLRLTHNTYFDLEDEPMIHLAKKLRDLKEVRIGFNPGLTDLSVDAFLTYCPKLEIADFSGLEHISTKPLLKIIAGDSNWFRRPSTMALFNRLGVKFWKKSSTAQEMEIRLPHRSTVFAPSLTHLYVIDCGLMTFHLKQIFVVCRRSLKIFTENEDTERGDMFVTAW